MKLQSTERTGTIWRHLRLRSLPPWAVSVVLHAVILLILAVVPAIGIQRKQPIELTTKLSELNRDFEFVDISHAQLGDSSLVDTALPSAPSSAPEIAREVTPERIEEKLPDPNVKPTVAMPMPAAPTLDTTVEVKGVSGETASGGAAGAVDRLTLEIKRSLEERKTLVIWLFDSSLSLIPEREQISARFGKVYSELTTLGQTNGDELLTAVAGFGTRTQIVTDKPTSDISELQRAVANIAPDENGTENVFKAVAEVTRKWSIYRTKGKRNVMVVVVTDERGDDIGSLEESLQAVRRYRVPVYVLGTAAVFGRDKGRQLWVDENGDRHLLPVDRGPESAAREWFDLPYWHGSGTDLFSSGFGPWGLARLCSESGGIYFIFKDIDGSEDFRFDSDALREYKPELCSKQEYDRRIFKSPLRKAIQKAAQVTQARVGTPTLQFPAYNEQVKQTSLRNGQTTQAQLQYLVEPGLQAMKGLEDTRAKEASKRWRAQYDLLYGRLLATKVRCYTYNAMCAKLRKNEVKFEKQENNAWRLVPDEEIPGDTPAGSELVDAAEEARKVLQRCVEENPGTPWATLAQRELNYELGFRWEEYRVVPPDQRPRNNNNRPRPNNNNRPRPMKKPVKIPKL